MEILRINKLQKSFGKNRVLKEISFTVNEGEFLTLIGPNGAGKTTLLNCLTLNLKWDSGDVFYKGENLKKVKEKFKKNINYISHNLFLYEQLTPIENLLFFSQAYNLNKGRDEIDKLLKRVNLLKFKGKKVATFSRGMKQRLTILRALLNNPEIIFLDEPFTGLDIKASEILSSLLFQLKKENRSVIMITHNITQAKNLSDRILGLYRGKISFQLERENFHQLEETFLPRVFK